MTKTLPTFDVVVPCYNEQDTIADCLDALLAQGKEIKHIIVVDNNSTDDTAVIVKRYQKKYSSIILVKEKRQGVQFARNTGFNKATSDVIGRIDADTVVQTGWAYAIRTYYARHPKRDMANGGDNTHYDVPFHMFAKRAMESINPSINKKLADSQLIYGSNTSIRRTIWQSVKDEVCMQDGIMEDQDLGYHALLSGASIGVIPDAAAFVSGRRMRMSPLRYWRYSRQIWMTFAIHGQRSQAILMRVMAWFTNILQLFFWLVLQFHDPVQKRFRLGYVFESKTERKIP